LRRNPPGASLAVGCAIAPPTLQLRKISKLEKLNKLEDDMKQGFSSKLCCNCSRLGRSLLKMDGEKCLVYVIRHFLHRFALTCVSSNPQEE